MSKKIAQRNNSIDIARIIVAISAVIVHADIFIDVDADLYNIVRYLVRFIVVFFLIISGYFYISATLKGRENFKAWFLSVLKVYCLWTLVYYAISFVTSVLIEKEPLDVFLIQRIQYFFIDGSFYHFWYFLALLYSMLAVHLAHRFFGEKGICVFAIIALLINFLCAFGTGYRFIGLNIPILSEFFKLAHFDSFVLICGVGFSSYSAGYFVYLVQTKKLLKPLTALYIFIFTLILYFAEAISLVLLFNSTENPKVFFTVYIMPIFMFIVALNTPMPKHTKLAEFGRKATGFIYYAHPLLLLGISMAGTLLGIEFSSITLSIIGVAVILLAAYVLIKIDNNFIRAFMGLGGKKIEK